MISSDLQCIVSSTVVFAPWGKLLNVHWHQLLKFIFGVMLYSINVNDPIWPTRILDYHSGSNLEVIILYLLICNFIIRFIYDWNISFGASIFTTLHFGDDFFYSLLIFLNDNISICAQIMQNLKLLISRVIGNMRG